MAKLDWAKGDILTQSRLNEPFYIASGVYNASLTQLELSLTPGRIRFPENAYVIASGQPQQFNISTPAANTYYHVFVRPHASGKQPAFMVSGTTVGAGAAGRPRHDAIPIGVVFSADLTTGNLVGPWNAGAYQEQYEARGAMAAPLPPHTIYVHNASPGSIAYNTNPNAASGIAFVTAANLPTLPHRSLLWASVTWTASGAFQSGESNLRLTPEFGISQVGLTAFLHTTHDAQFFTIAPNPDDAVTRGAQRTFTTTFIAVDHASAPSTAGYVLKAFFDPNGTDPGPAPAIRVLETTFVCMPGVHAELDVMA